MCRSGARRAFCQRVPQKSRHGISQICLERHASADANPGGWVEKEKLLSPKSLVIPGRINCAEISGPLWQLQSNCDGVIPDHSSCERNKIRVWCMAGNGANWRPDLRTNNVRWSGTSNCSLSALQLTLLSWDMHEEMHAAIIIKSKYPLIFYYRSKNRLWRSCHVTRDLVQSRVSNDPTLL